MNLPDDLKWLKWLMGYDPDKMILDCNPCRIEIDGEGYVVALYGAAMTAVRHSHAADLPPSKLAEQIAKFLDVGGLKSVTVNLHALRVWAGAALQTHPEFDEDGNGPEFIPRLRSCKIFGAYADCNLLALALDGLPRPKETDVQVYYRGPMAPITFVMEGARVVLMPIRTGLAILDDDGLRSPWGADAEEAAS